METYVLEETPLAAYLEGKGEADNRRIEAVDDKSSPPHTPLNQRPPSYAPHSAPPTFQNHRQKTTSLFQKKPVTRLRNAYAYAVASTLGSADNLRFLEHFRYILIASQLLNESVAPGALRDTPSQAPASTEYGPAAVSVWGAAISAAVAFALVWLLHRSRDEENTFDKSRLLFALGAFVLAGLLFYGYVRRQWLQHLRHQTLTASTDFVAHTAKFEVTSTAILAMIQEVEVVSRGYRLSSPLPPISRLDTVGSPRRCSRLRRNLRHSYIKVIPVFVQAVNTLRPFAKFDDLDRLLEVYDIREADISDAMEVLVASEDEDMESLRQLRVHQARLSLLRRLLVCILLSIPASGRKEDAPRWHNAVEQMSKISTNTAEEGQSIAKLLHDEENLRPPSSPGPPSVPASPNAQAKSRSQSRHIAQLSSSMRSVQARLYLFRDDSARALSNSTSEIELSALSTSLKEQYDAIGDDIRALMHAWESGRQTLVEDISRQGRRVSRVSSAYRSSTPSIGGLTAVEENESDGDSHGSLSPRATAFQKLVGDRPLSPPTTESGDEGSKDDEVFEAVARPLPRQRSTLTREERIRNMHEAREKQANMREKRDANMNMIRELQTVINLRPQRRNTVTGPG